MLNIQTWSKVIYLASFVLGNDERVRGQTYQPSMTGKFFYSEIQKYETNGIYYIDAKTEN